MYYLNYLLNLESNYLIGGILLGVVIVLCGGLGALALLTKKSVFDTVGAVVSGLLVVTTTLLAYNILIMVAFLLAVAAFAYFMTRVCQEYHKKTIYQIPFWKLYFRMFFPTYIATMLFRPWFTQVPENTDPGSAPVLAGLGLNGTGTYVYDITVINESGTGTVWNIISVVQALLFLTVFIMQILLIWREFVDPDNAPTWATFGMIVTGIGGMFIYGVYTSPNFHIATYMEQGSKIDLSTMEEVVFFQPAQSNLDHLTFAPIVLILFGILNRIFYIEKIVKKKKQEQ